MKVIDTHCDALQKLQLSSRREAGFEGLLDYGKAPEIDTNLERLMDGEVFVQFYAIFFNAKTPANEQWQHALEQVDFFYTEIIEKHPNIKHIRNWNELDQLKPGEIGAVLTLEGGEAIGNDLMKLRQLYRLGVMSVGLTWNPANLLADGVGEERGGGLTALGKEVVQLNNEHTAFTDVAHLSEKGFWEVMELADYPIASHANARAVFDHRRNLYDEQIQALIEKGGMMHLVFHPAFTAEGEDVNIQDFIRHVDHICSIGGKKHIGFGSDFDGIQVKIKNLGHAGKYQNLIDELLKTYSEEDVKGFAYQNFLDHRPGK